MKIETKSEPKSDTLSAVIRWLRCLASRIPDNEKECRNLDALRLKMILRYAQHSSKEKPKFPPFVLYSLVRILQTNSFSGKMNALNEVNKLIMSLTTIQRSTVNRSEEVESLTAEKLTVSPSMFFSSNEYLSFSNGLKKIKYWISSYAIVYINLNTWKN